MPDYKQLMKRRMTAREVNKGPAQGKKVFIRVVLLLIVGGIVFSSWLASHSLLLNFSAFNIKKILVVDEKARTVENPEQIFRLEHQANLFSLDIKKVAEDIQARHPELYSVVVHKQFPHTLLIVVKRREPVAIVGMQKICLVDRAAFVLPYESQYAHLPKIVGIHPKQLPTYEQSPSLSLKRALQLLEELKKARVYPQYRVSQIDVRQQANLVLYLEDEIEVKMGEEDFARKVVLLSAILSQLKASGTIPQYIDMRFDSPLVLP